MASLLATDVILQLPVVVAKAAKISVVRNGLLRVTLDRTAPAAVSLPVRLIGTACMTACGTTVGLVAVVEGVTVLLMEACWESTRRRMATHGVCDDRVRALAMLAAATTVVAVPLLCFGGTGLAYALSVAGGQIKSTVTCFVGHACTELTLYVGRVVARGALWAVAQPFHLLWRWLTTTSSRGPAGEAAPEKDQNRAPAATTAAAATAAPALGSESVRADESAWEEVDLTQSLIDATSQLPRPLVPSDESAASQWVTEMELSAHSLGCELDRRCVSQEISASARGCWCQ